MLTLVRRDTQTLCRKTGFPRGCEGQVCILTGAGAGHPLWAGFVRSSSLSLGSGGPMGDALSHTLTPGLCDAPHLHTLVHMLRSWGQGLQAVLSSRGSPNKR